MQGAFPYLNANAKEGARLEVHSGHLGFIKLQRKMSQITGMGKKVLHKQ